MFEWLRTLTRRIARPRVAALPSANQPDWTALHPQPVNRCPLNVRGPFYTLGMCLACEAPEALAPDLLAPLRDGNYTTYFVKQPETPEEVARACSAIGVCCVMDLRYGGTDPAIIQRLGNDENASDIIFRDGRLVLSQRAETIADRPYIGCAPPHAIRFDPRWLSSTVRDLARAIYDEGVFERMPILGDALMDAGCDSEEIIQHCQSAGMHARGCWVVDLILEKA